MEPGRLGQPYVVVFVVVVGGCGWLKDKRKG